MKILAASFLFLLGSLCTQLQSHFALPATQETGAQQQSAPATAMTEQQKVDPAKEADIRKLLELTGAKAIESQTMSGMESGIRPLMTNSLPPGEYREKLIELFFEKFHTKAKMENLVNLSVPVYDKYLSDEEVKGLIQFYETPLGQKAVSVLPKMTQEIQQQGREWGQKMGRESMEEVLTEHPELEKALEDAQRAAQRP
jgi:uncharacterized protein